MRIHILGICGTLMGSIALLARQQGNNVTGSDVDVYPPMSEQLESAGIRLATGNTAANIPPDTDLVMIGNANLPRGNDAVEFVLDRGLPYISGAEWLGRYLLPGRWVIAVAGTHGKTTTTSMVSWILEHAGLTPGFLVGGVPANFGISARLGESPFFVIEADEYDTSYFDRRSKFLHYRPRTAILNNLEYDHADIFPDLAAIQNQFHLLLRTIPGTGQVIHPAVDDNLAQVFDRGCWTPRVAFANEPGATGPHFTRPQSADASTFDVVIDGKPAGTISWQLTGQHNLNNALAAILASRHAGVPPGVACEALNTFAGVKRRMELIYESAGLRVYDDFAHHPTAIRTTLEGLRAQVGAERIVAIVEPGSHTMRKGTHAHSLAQAVERADQVLWYRPQNVHWQMDSLMDGHRRLVLDQVDDIVQRTLTETKAGPCHVVIMSNGSFGGFRQKMLVALRTHAGN